MYFLLALSLMVAWYFPIKIVVSRLLWPPAVDQGVRDSYSFVALAYEGVSEKETEVSPAQFKDQLDTLRANGYVPIKLEDVRKLIMENEPLPRKAVLLTFDHGRRTSYFGVKSHIRRAGWNGVMFLWTRPIEDHDNASLLWPYVRSMVRSQSWEIGAESYDGYSPVKANASGRTGHFMTTPRWLDREMRFETPDEFMARIQGDHEKSLALIEKRVGIKPIAYAYPYGDFGQYQSRGTFMRRVNLAQMSQHYDLGFVAGNLAINTRHSDPRRLNRLRVRPEWSGADLLAYLERSWPSESLSLEGTGSEIASAWIVDWGEMKMENDRMSLQAADRTTGAKMWLGGSDLARDFYARIEFKLFQGQLGIYLRASSDEETYVYLGLDSRGEAWLRERARGQDQERWDESRDSGELNIWLRQKHLSLDRFTLASSHARMEPSDTHTLELFVRDKLLYALVDGRPLFGSHIRLRGEAKPGMIGISVWDPTPGRARVDIAGVSLQNQRPTLAMWGDKATYSPYVVQWIHQNSYQLTQISPLWISFSPVGQLVRDTWDKEILSRLAKIYHLKLTPRVRIDEEEWLSRIPPSQLADNASEAGLDGLFINLENIRNPTPTRVATWLQQCGVAMQEKGLSMLVKLPIALERPAAINSILAVIPTLQVVTAKDSPLNADAQSRKLSTAQVETIPEPDRDADLPIYYEIMAMPDSPDDQTLQTRASQLEQEGQAAFLDSDYERAVASWTEWRDLEPNNPRPSMLIGDAYLRLNDARTAITFYDQSLELDPGQVALALRRIRLMDSQGMEDEAINDLNLYARLFPENVEILMAQAEWLRAHGQSDKARTLVERALRLEPYNMDAITTMIRLTDKPQDRMKYLHQMIDYGKNADLHYELGQAIWKNDLLSLPEAHALNSLVIQIHDTSKDPRVRLLYDKLVTRSRSVNETFAGGGLSESWWVNGGDSVEERGKIRLRAEAGRTEVSARLLGSERLRDAYIESTIRSWDGQFWLYMRRTENQMVRFGFETPDRMHLQVWKEGRLVLNESKPVALKEGPLKLRMEIRGGGLMGFVNDQPLFDAAVAIPSDLWFGWSGLAAFNARRGTASVTVSTLSSGPLPVRVVMLPANPTAQDMDILLEGLRPHVRSITDMAPRWFTIRPDGEWVSHLSQEDRLFRLFTRYHRIRLMPVVEVLSGPEMPVRDLVKTIHDNGLDGVILLYPSMPSEKWFEEMRKLIDMNPVDVLVMTTDTERRTAQCRALGASVDLLFSSGDEAGPMRLLSGSLQNPEFQEAIEALPPQDPATLIL